MWVDPTEDPALRRPTVRLVVKAVCCLLLEQSKSAGERRIQHFEAFRKAYEHCLRYSITRIWQPIR